MTDKRWLILFVCIFPVSIPLFTLGVVLAVLWRALVSGFVAITEWADMD